jgi:hypothetical protein
VRLDPDVDVLAAEVQAVVAKHRARQQACFEQHLEAVADAKHRAAGLGEAPYLSHDRREAGDGTRAQVVAVRESTGQDHGVGAAQAGVLVPDKGHVLTQHAFDRVVRVVVAVGTREDDHSEFHRLPPADSTSTR